MNSHDTVPFNLILVLVPLEAVLIERLGGPPPSLTYPNLPFVLDHAISHDTVPFDQVPLETVLVERLGGPPPPPLFPGLREDNEFLQYRR